MLVERYSPTRRAEWDEFIRRSKNGTFLFFRDYMDYHADRFVDYSWLIRDDRGKLVAVLPANRTLDGVYTHGGLTYGGFVTGDDMRASTMLHVFRSTLDTMKQDGVTRMVYKTIPYIYSRLPAEEDRYALFLSQGRVIRRDILSVIPREGRLAFQERRRRGVKTALKAGLSVALSDRLEDFWQVLSSNLNARYKVAPAHRVEEMQLLMARFPRNIRFYACREGEKLRAGVVIYDTGMVAHAQYISADDRGRELGALDVLFQELIATSYSASPYFDFGSSTAGGGMWLNVGLCEQKEGFGARTVVHDQYEIDVSSWEPQLIEDVVAQGPGK
jgi:hypothetical protein